MFRSMIVMARIGLATCALLAVVVPLTTGRSLPALLDLASLQHTVLARVILVGACVLFAARAGGALWGRSLRRLTAPDRSRPVKLSTVMWALLVAGVLLAAVAQMGDGSAAHQTAPTNRSAQAHSVRQ